MQAIKKPPDTITPSVFIYVLHFDFLILQTLINPKTAKKLSLGFSCLRCTIDIYVALKPILFASFRSEPASAIALSNSV